MDQRIKQNVQKLPWHHIHFVGIGGVGMAGLALLINELGVRVTGEDNTESTNTNFLKNKGLSITINQLTNLSDKPDRIVYSSAIREDSLKFQLALSQRPPLLRRGEFLAELAELYPKSVLVGGSHGKTTVTAMLAHILTCAGVNPAYLVGGGIDNRPILAGAGNGHILVAEVDESDGSQSKTRATHAIITNIDDDHFWSVGGLDNLMDCFRKFAFSSASLLSYDEPVTRRLFSEHQRVEFFSSSQIYKGLDLSIPGFHNRLNASLAIFAATRLGISSETAIRSINKFPGVARRLSIRYRSRGMTVIEDYAHHPSAIRESINAIREIFPKNRLIIVFQPHRYERVLVYARRFADELSRANVVFILPPFGAWLDNQNLSDSRMIIKEIEGIQTFYLTGSFPHMAHKIINALQKGDVLTIMGAGDITGLVPAVVKLAKKIQVWL